MSHTPGPWHWENMPRPLIKSRTGDYDPGGGCLGKLVGANGAQVLWLGHDEPDYTTCGDEPSPDDAALIAQAPAMLALLEELEWSIYGWPFRKCPICDGEYDDPTQTRGVTISADGHKSDCRLNAVLKAAKGER